MVNLPEFTGKDLREFAENFCRFLRLTGQNHASGRVKCDLLLQCCKTKYLKKQVKQIVTKSATFADVLVALERQYPTYETDLSIRAEIQNLPMLPNNPKPGRVSELLADLDGRLHSRAIAAEEKKNQEKDAQPEKIQRKINFSDLRNPQKILRRCLARSQNLGHSQKKKNNRVAMATKLSVACPKTPSKVRVLGARDLCALQQQRR